MDYPMKMTVRQVVPLAFALALAGTLSAQDDPPSRVARLSYMTGQVSFEPPTVNEWGPATLNYPLTTGDNLYTDVNASRAVLRLSRNSIRLAPGTNFQFVNLSDQVTQMSINSGALIVKLRNLWDGESWEVDTPNGAVTLLRTGEYRIDTDPNRNATMVTVRSGDAEVTSNNQSFPVHARQTVYLDPNGQPNIADMNPPDDFDQFGYSRDRIEDAPAALCFSVCDRVRRPGRLRHLAAQSGLRVHVGTARGIWMGALSQRPLGLGGTVGLDMGG